MDFVPFYRLHRRTYGVYWDLYTPAEWEKKAAERQRKLDVADIDRQRILKLADEALSVAPISITQSRAQLSEGGPHDFYSNGDYWWPDPNKPDGLPYIQRDGQSNPQNFSAHRLALRNMRDAVAALAAAYALDGQEKYAEKAVALLKVFFLDEATKMNPSLLYAQAIPGRFSGRGIGIIDTLHLAEVPPAILALSTSRAMTPEILAGLKKWFGDYAQWMTTHKYGLDEMNAKNNHSVAFMVQLASFATLDGRHGQARSVPPTLQRGLRPAADGPRRQLPPGTAAHQALRLLDLPARQHGDPLPTALDGDGQPLDASRCPTAEASARRWSTSTPSCRTRRKWPLKPDVEHFESWPVRQPALLFAAHAFGEKKYLDLWKTLNPDPTDQEVQRNMAITQPLLWLISPADVPLSRN